MSEWPRKQKKEMFKKKKKTKKTERERTFKNTTSKVQMRDRKAPLSS